jgi:hypothetical protein
LEDPAMPEKKDNSDLPDKSEVDDDLLEKSDT